MILTAGGNILFLLSKNKNGVVIKLLSGKSLTYEKQIKKMRMDRGALVSTRIFEINRLSFK